MENTEFKKLFDDISKHSGFKKAFGGWYKESLECIAVLELQKSNFTNSYYLNIKVFIQGVFGANYFIDKDLISSPIGDVTNQIKNKDFLELDEPMNYNLRKEKLENLFLDFIIPFTEKVLLKSGVRELAQKGEIHLLPAIKEELAKV